jgi:hypothetical protein
LRGINPYSSPLPGGKGMAAPAPLRRTLVDVRYTMIIHLDRFDLVREFCD